MEKKSFNLEAYQSLRKEIDLRLSIHYKLLLAKYAFGGGLFAYLITHQSGLPVSISAFLVVAAFAFLLDVAILENLGVIRLAGSFIKNTIETTDLNIIKWETIGAQPLGRWTCFTIPGYVLGTWSSGVFFFIGAFVVDLRKIDRVSLFATLVCFYLLVYTGYLIFKHLGGSGIKVDSSPSPITR